MKFFNAYVVTSSSKCDSLWVGTNEGSVLLIARFVELLVVISKVILFLGVILLYSIADDATNPEDVCVLLKELHLQHRAPVIDFECAASDGSAFGKVGSYLCSFFRINILPLSKQKKFLGYIKQFTGHRVYRGTDKEFFFTNPKAFEI